VTEAQQMKFPIQVVISFLQIAGR